MIDTRCIYAKTYLNVFTNFGIWKLLLKLFSLERPVGKDSLYDSVSLNQSDNEFTQSDLTTFPSSNLNLEPWYFEHELKSLRINNINRVIMDQINVDSIRSKFSLYYMYDAF